MTNCLKISARLLFGSLLLLNAIVSILSFVPNLPFTRHAECFPSSSVATSAIIRQTPSARDRLYGICRSRTALRDTQADSVDENKDGNDQDDEVDEMEEEPLVIYLVDDSMENDSILEEYDYEDDDEDEEPEEDDPYKTLASSEFMDEGDDNKASSSALAALNPTLDTTFVDWGGALGKLRERVEDVESGKSQDPSHVLFRLMSSQSPNQLIGKFITSANPQVVQAMSGAVGSLLGGLSNPNVGVETIVKASGEKIGSLCFQLQMTGYMFRNAEYVLALKDLLNLQGKVSLDDYKAAFERLDTDGSGYIETTEIQALFDDVYGEKAPSFEIEAFLEFFDQNKDGKISWEEFEQGLGVAVATQKDKDDSAASRALRLGNGLADDDDDDDEYDDDESINIDANVVGTIEIELDDGKIVTVEAKEYIDNLKAEAEALKEALRREKYGDKEPAENNAVAGGLLPDGSAGGGAGMGMDIAGYIASRQGDVKSLTEGISPEVVETMRSLVNFVLEGGESGRAKKQLTDADKAQMEMEIPGAALQQLALWQLVLGYRLREAEVTGDYKTLMQK